MVIIMNRNEKKEKKAFIGGHLDIRNTRLKDGEVNFLFNFIREYKDKYKGQTDTKKNRFSSWCSDGKFTRREENTYTFNDDISIQEEYKYNDDDGQSGGYSNKIKAARGILNWFKKHKIK